MNPASKVTQLLKVARASLVKNSLRDRCFMALSVALVPFLNHLNHRTALV
jgi:hypothetical protein